MSRDFRTHIPVHGLALRLSGVAALAALRSNIAIRLTLKHIKRYAGLIAIAPMTSIADDIKPPFWQVPLLRALKHLFPTLAIIPNKVTDEGFRDKSLASVITEHPLTNPIGAIRLATADECMTACETLRTDEIDIPLLIIHGTQDTVIPIETSKALLADAPSPDKTLVVIEDAFHCINAEPPSIQRKVSDSIDEWLQSRIEEVDEGVWD